MVLEGGERDHDGGLGRRRERRCELHLVVAFQVWCCGPLLFNREPQLPKSCENHVVSRNQALLPSNACRPGRLPARPPLRRPGSCQPGQTPLSKVNWGPPPAAGFSVRKLFTGSLDFQWSLRLHLSAIDFCKVRQPFIMKRASRCLPTLTKITIQSHKRVGQLLEGNFTIRNGACGNALDEGLYLSEVSHPGWHHSWNHACLE